MFSNQKTYNKEESSQKLTGINRYYHRLHQGGSGSTYYIEPRELCPVDVLNQPDRFVIVSFDRDDDYIVVNNERLYLTKQNSIKATNKTQRRIAVVDLDQLEQSKRYKYDEKFARRYTFTVDEFEDLRNLARSQYEQNGAPYIKQILTQNGYYYEPSFSRQVVPA